MHGYYGKGERIGPALALVIKSGDRHDRFEVKPLAAEAEYWNYHLLDSPMITIQLQHKMEEENLLAGSWKNMKQDLIEKWGAVSLLGTVPDFSEFS